MGTSLLLETRGQVKERKHLRPTTRRQQLHETISVRTSTTVHSLVRPGRMHRRISTGMPLPLEGFYS